MVGAPHPRAGYPLLDPVIEYQNEHNPLGGGLGHVVVGGHVYRGAELRQFSGDYIFGDYSREEEEPDGSLFVAKPRKAGLWNMQQLQVTNRAGTHRLGHFLLGFGQDLAGEMYVLGSDEARPNGHHPAGLPDHPSERLTQHHVRLGAHRRRAARGVRVWPPDRASHFLPAIV